MQQFEATLAGRLDISNHGSPSTGEYRAGLSLTANSPMHLGDRLSANLMTTETGDLASYNLRYELPVGGDGWHLSASGQARSIRLDAAYPLLRSRAANLKL